MLSPLEEKREKELFESDLSNLTKIGKELIERSRDDPGRLSRVRKCLMNLQASAEKISDERLFESNVTNLVKQFKDNPEELEELIKDRKKIISDYEALPSAIEQAKYEVGTFEEALRRIEEKKEGE